MDYLTLVRQLLPLADAGGAPPFEPPPPSRFPPLPYPVPEGPRMQFQPDMPLDPSQVVDYRRPGSQPWWEANYRAWQHILGSLGGPTLPPDLPGLR